MENNLHYKIALSRLKGFGVIKTRQIINALDNIDDFFSLAPYQLEKKYGIRKEWVKRSQRKEALQEAEEILKYNEKHSVSTLFIHDREYPRRLLKCDDAPIVLYQRGKMNLNPTKSVAIVGTRNSTHYGHKVCEELIERFVGNDILVVSGLASGIDGYSHQKCLNSRIPTVGIVGHGLDRIYPAKHRKLALDMLESGNAILSEFIPGIYPDPCNFPMRNRIVAGMADATIVVESKNKGGSLITANLANDYNRDVFAVPGPIFTSTSQGCNQLIEADKAHLYKNPNAFLKLMNWENSQQSKEQNIQANLFPEVTPIQEKILEIITENGMLQVDLLSDKMEIPISQLNTELFFLEMEGLIQNVPGNNYKRI